MTHSGNAITEGLTNYLTDLTFSILCYLSKRESYEQDSLFFFCEINGKTRSSIVICRVRLVFNVFLVKCDSAVSCWLVWFYNVISTGERTKSERSGEIPRGKSIMSFYGFPFGEAPPQTVARVGRRRNFRRYTTSHSPAPVRSPRGKALRRLAAGRAGRPRPAA